MSLPGVPAHEILSFRHVLESSLKDFLSDEGLDFEHAAAGLAEVLVALWRHREEGEPLYPAMFVTNDLDGMLQRLEGRDALCIGRGPREPTTLRTAIKHCAPLGQRGWSIYVVGREDGLEYGLFRNDDLLLSPGPMGRLRSLHDRTTRIMGVAQLADNVLELRGAAGSRRLIYLAGAAGSTRPLIALVHQLAAVIASDVVCELRDSVRTFWLRLLLDAMRGTHGSLIAVLPTGVDVREVFADGIVLDTPIDVTGRVRAYLDSRTEDSRTSLQGAGSLIEGMLGVDGITVVRGDGAVVAYNVFLRFPEALGSARVGGARRRAFEALQTYVGPHLLAAFVRSQDGPADIEISSDLMARLA